MPNRLIFDMIEDAVHRNATRATPEEIEDWHKMKHDWTGHAANAQVAAELEHVAKTAFTKSVPLAFPKLTINPMEVRTFLATFE